jgi:hypothetical protein
MAWGIVSNIGPEAYATMPSRQNSIGTFLFATMANPSRGDMLEACATIYGRPT